MVLKIVGGPITKNETTIYIECDRFEYKQIAATELSEKQFDAVCWLKGEFREWYFTEAYLMENGKTIEHLYLIQLPPVMPYPKT